MLRQVLGVVGEQIWTSSVNILFAFNNTRAGNDVLIAKKLGDSTPKNLCECVWKIKEE